MQQRYSNYLTQQMLVQQNGQDPAAASKSATMGHSLMQGSGQRAHSDIKMHGLGSSQAHDPSMLDRKFQSQQ